MKSCYSFWLANRKWWIGWLKLKVHKDCGGEVKDVTWVEHNLLFPVIVFAFTTVISFCIFCFTY